MNKQVIKFDCKAVIFDLDGTLVNTLEDIAASVNQSLAKYDLPAHEIDSFKQKVGDGARKMIERCLPAAKIDLLEPVLAQYKENYGKNLLNLSGPYPGMVQTLKSLQDKGLKLAVLSNKPDEQTQKIVSALFPDTFEVICGHVEGAPLKPDPRVVFDIARELRIPAREMIYVGDSGVDMQMARAAGMGAVGALWGFRDKRELEENGAEAVIETPGELLELIS